MEYEDVGSQLWIEMTNHKPARGGTLGILVGEQGSGKSTLLLKIANKLMKKGELIIWRGRPREQVRMLPGWKDHCVFWFYHKDDYIINEIRGDLVLKIHELLNIRTYRNAEDIIRYAEKNKINVVYEPAEYYIDPESELFKFIGFRYGKKSQNKAREQQQEPHLFWYEIFECLRKRKDVKWYSILMDEFDEIVPDNPMGVRWGIQQHLKDIIRDLRKARVSLFGSIHYPADADFRIHTKIQFWLYLPGARIRQGSIMEKHLVSFLDTGECFIEKNTFGKVKFYPFKLSKNESYIDDVIVEWWRKKAEGKSEQMLERYEDMEQQITNSIERAQDDEESILKEYLGI